MRMPTTVLLSAVVLASAGALLMGQQQAAEAPASSRPAATRPAVAGRHGLVAAGHPIASSAGLQMLLKGGNAFDAAVAVSSTLGLVEPESSGLGGGGFMLLHLAKGERDVFVDAREKAPMAATRDMYLDAKGEADRKQTTIGARAAAIPGMPAGLVHLARKYGRLPLEKSFAPAIRLAENGWTFGRKNATMMGYRAAIADGALIIVKIDSDGQMDPSLIPFFVAPIMSGEADYTKGNRFFNASEPRIFDGIARFTSYAPLPLVRDIVRGVRTRVGVVGTNLRGALRSIDIAVRPALVV